MAFSAVEKMQIIRLLGWPARTVDQSSTYYASYVADRLINIADEVQAAARALLARIVAIDDRLESAIKRAAVQQISDITLNKDEMEMLRRERSRVVRELSSLFDIPVYGGSGGSVIV